MDKLPICYFGAKGTDFFWKNKALFCQTGSTAPKLSIKHILLIAK